MADYIFNIILGLLVLTPIVAIVIYEVQPEWYKKDQEHKHAKVTLVILILGLIVLILNRLNII
jgi:uncharacterized membrane protein